MKRFSVLLFVAAAAIAQTQSGQDWGEWGKSSQAGIQVRVFCKADTPIQSDLAVVMSAWKYQFRNTTATPIRLRWRAEHFDAAVGANRLAPPATSTVDAGKATQVLDSSLLGSCAKLSAMHLMVLPPARSSTASKQIRGTKSVRARAVRDGGNVNPAVFAYQGTAPAVSNTPEPAPGADAAIPVPEFRGIPGSSWQCQMDEGGRHSFIMSFDKAGQYFITRDDGRDTFAGAPESADKSVIWSDRLGRLYSLEVNGNSMSGKTSTFDRISSRGRDYNGTIVCARLK